MPGKNNSNSQLALLCPFETGSESSDEEEGVFTSHSSYSFSGVEVTQEGSEDSGYCSQLFYMNLDQHNQYNIDYVVIRNTEAQITVSSIHYY